MSGEHKDDHGGKKDGGNLLATTGTKALIALGVVFIIAFFFFGLGPLIMLVSQGISGVGDAFGTVPSALNHFGVNLSLSLMGIIKIVVVAALSFGILYGVKLVFEAMFKKDDHGGGGHH